MQPKTHQLINKELCGKPVEIGNGKAMVELLTDEKMAVDEEGLVHGGFVFGLADYAAMLAVNDPFVVLGSADVRFLKPVKVGDKLIAKAKIESSNGRKRIVNVDVLKNGETVFNGTFTCFVLDKHVLKKK